jgi:hypothetical protein
MPLTVVVAITVYPATPEYDEEHEYEIRSVEPSHRQEDCGSRLCEDCWLREYASGVGVPEAILPDEYQKPGQSCVLEIRGTMISMGGSEGPEEEFEVESVRKL